jgi:hypothetical protein
LFERVKRGALTPVAFAPVHWDTFLAVENCADRFPTIAEGIRVLGHTLFIARSYSFVCVARLLNRWIQYVTDASSVAGIRNITRTGIRGVLDDGVGDLSRARILVITSTRVRSVNHRRVDRGIDGSGVLRTLVK